MIGDTGLRAAAPPPRGPWRGGTPRSGLSPCPRRAGAHGSPASASAELARAQNARRGRAGATQRPSLAGLRDSSSGRLAQSALLRTVVWTVVAAAFSGSALVVAQVPADRPQGGRAEHTSTDSGGSEQRPRPAGDDADVADGPRAAPESPIEAAQVRAVLAVAPPDAVGVLHLDARVVLQLLTEHEALIVKRFRGIQGLARKLERVQAVLKKTDSVDVFLRPGRKNPVLAVHGRLAPADVVALLRSIYGRGRTELKSLPGLKGWYDLPVGDLGGFRFLVGAQAKGVPAGVLLIGDTETLRPTYVAQLGAGKPDRLLRRLTAEQVAAPVWVGIRRDEEGTPERAIAVTGSLDPRGQGTSDLCLRFTTEAAARAHLPQLEEHRWLHGLLQARRMGQVVTLRRGPNDGSFIGDLMRVADRARALHNLRRIGQAILTYRLVHGAFPADLQVLVERDWLGADQLVSPTHPRDQTDRSNGATPRPHYVYVRYPDEAHPPLGLILVYERAEHYGDTHTGLVRVDGEVAYVSLAEFQRSLRRTRSWLAEHAKQSAGERP